jgi:Rieske Fe-S protein
MDRRKFLINSCAACISASAITNMFSSCTSIRYIKGALVKDGLTIEINEFISKKKNKNEYLPFIIVRNEALQYPVCVYRFSENEYTALWMQCTHQGTELQASGDRLQCPAHGSEFDNKGAIKTGPADKALRSFPVTISNNQLFIDLRAI